MLSPMLWLGLVALGVLAIASIRKIPEGQVYTLRRFGGHTRLMHSGMHLMWPFVERVAHKISLTGANVPVEGLSDADRQYRGIVYFQVLDPARADRVIDNVDRLLRERTRSLFADAALPEAFDSRRQWLKQSLNSDVRERGLIVTRVELSAVN